MPLASAVACCPHASPKAVSFLLVRCMQPKLCPGQLAALVATKLLVWSLRLAPQVCWAHPKFGSLLATASFDGKVIVWKEVADNVWQQVGSTCAVDL